MSIFTAAELTVKIKALRSAIDSGVLSIGHGVDKVQYQSLADMWKVLRRLEAELACVNGETPRPRVGYIEQTSKGFGEWPGQGSADDTTD